MTSTSKKSRVQMLNVGQGDSFAVRLPTGQVVVIDCNRHDPIDAPPVQAVLEAWGAERGEYSIDVLCLTHPHTDHFAGMSDLIRWCWSRGGEVRNLVLYDYAFEDLGPEILSILEDLPIAEFRRDISEFGTLRERFDEICARLASRKFSKADGNFCYGSGCKFVTQGEGFRIYTVGPTGLTTERYRGRGKSQMLRELTDRREHRGPEANDLSVMLAIELDAGTLLFTGDASRKSLRDSWSEYREARPTSANVRVLKVPHHGSATGRDKDLWKAILPLGEESIAMLSYGIGNRYGHPDGGLLEDFASIDVATVSTARCSACADSDAAIVLADEDDAASDDAASDDESGDVTSGVVIELRDQGRSYEVSGHYGHVCGLCNSCLT